MNVLELFAVIGVKDDGFKQGLKNMAAATVAVGTAVAGLSTASVKAYSNYEQLSGGVAKLYGAAGMSLEKYADSVGKTTGEAKTKYDSLVKAQNIVMKNAQNAFANAGMSANQYMETATQFSASLINSLGGDTVKAAQMTDVAMRAISDNVNTFGSSMTDVENAYKGFSKQNYTMLDNLNIMGSLVA